MNRKEALAYNEYLKNELDKIGVECGNDENVGNYVVDHYIEIFPEDPRKGIIFLGDRTVSCKPGNIKVNLKKSLSEGIEFLISLNKPESTFNYIQLILNTIIFIGKITTVEISEIEVYVVQVLYSLGKYDVRIEEEKLISKVIEVYKDREGGILEKRKVLEAIDNLCKMKTLEMEDGSVYLNETIWLIK